MFLRLRYQFNASGPTYSQKLDASPPWDDRQTWCKGHSKEAGESRKLAEKDTEAFTRLLPQRDREVDHWRRGSNNFSSPRPSDAPLPLSFPSRGSVSFTLASSSSTYTKPSYAHFTSHAPFACRALAPPSQLIDRNDLSHCCCPWYRRVLKIERFSITSVFPWPTT